MKKGLILALLMATLVALTMPAGAVAPVIPELPTIIIGGADADDASTLTTTKRVLRYLNVLDLLDSSVVDWRNATYTSDTYRAYWSAASDTSGIELGLANAGGFIDELTAGEMAALSTGTPPAVGSNLTKAGSFFVSLMNLSATTTGTAPTTPHFGKPGIETWGLDYNASGGYMGYSFDIATTRNGAGPLMQDSLSSAATVVTLYAAVTSGSTQVLSSPGSPLEIYSLLTSTDKTTSSYQIQLLADDLELQWFQNGLPDPSDTLLPGVFSSSGCGFVVNVLDDPSGKIMFATWMIGTDGTGMVFPLGAGTADIPAGSIYAAHFRLRNNAAPTGDLSPGFRFAFTNASYTHHGGIEVNTYDAGNSPTRDADAWVHLFWSVPRDMTAMAEAASDPGNDWLAEVDTVFQPVPFSDFRDYGILFDLFHTQLGDYGVFTLEEFLVEQITKPTGGSANAFGDMSDTSWGRLSFSFLTGYQDGTLTRTASSVTMVTGTDTTGNFRFIGSEPNLYFPNYNTGVVGTLGDHPLVPENELCLLSASAVSVGDSTNTPMTRLYLAATRADFTADATQPFQSRNVVWFTIYGTLFESAKQNTWNVRGELGTPEALNPGVPPVAAGATLECYAHTGKGLYAAGDYLHPQFSVLSLNNYLGTGQGWDDDFGGVTISDVDITTGLSY